MSVDFTGWKAGDRGVMEVEFEFIKGDGPSLFCLRTASSASSSWHNTDRIKSITRIEPPIKEVSDLRDKGLLPERKAT